MAPPEALAVLYQAMRAELQRCIRMVIEIAGEPSVFFVYFFQRQLETKAIR